MHTFTIELDDREIDAIATAYGYPTQVSNRDVTTKQERSMIDNPISPAVFAQKQIEKFIDQITDDHIGTLAVKDAHAKAVNEFRKRKPRR